MPAGVPTVGGSDGVWGTLLNAHLAVEHTAADGTHSAITPDSVVIGADGATVTGIKDEDTMSSNSAVKLCTQQSIVAFTSFGTWTDKDSGGSVALAKNEIYRVGSDGIVCAKGVEITPTNFQLISYTDSNSSPSTVRVSTGGALNTSGGDYVAGITFPVKKNDYWKVIASTGNGDTAVVTIYWLPSGSGTCVKQ